MTGYARTPFLAAPVLLALGCVLAALCPALFGVASVEAAGGPVAVDAELVFAVDISRSMNRPEQELQRAGYVAALKSPEFLDALKANPLGKVAVAYIEWSDAEDQEVVLPWSLIDGPAAADSIADKLAAAPLRSAFRTSISGGIDFSVNMFQNNGFNSRHEVIDVSGDGPNNSGRPVVQARADAIAKGITINGLPLVGIRPYIGPADIEDLDVYYRDCVVGGDGAFMVTVHDTKDFVTATRSKLVREIAALPPAEASIVLVQSESPAMDCMIGEKKSRRFFRMVPPSGMSAPPND